MAATTSQFLGATEGKNFHMELQSMINQFKIYENPSNQSAALAEVPYDYLMAVSQAKYESTQPKSVSKLDEQNVVRDIFLLELMNWFKTDFFSWVDTPNCPRCSKPTVAIGHGVPTLEESTSSASRVEIYTCKSCFTDNREVVRFPRFNNPVILLKTRKGRCGEWANCFALICRAVGFEVRYIRDWTDHVWVEVFSCSLNPNRWVHVDPCENSYDSPLLYETGWGKKLSYVIGVSKDDIQDVTWRYIQDGSLVDVLSRRRLIDERALVTVLVRLKNELQGRLSIDRQNVLKMRLIQELAEFMYPRPKGNLKDSEKIGRESGSLAWRLARQEMGSEEGTIGDKPFIWEIKKENVINSKYCITYDCAKDQYAVPKNGALVERKSGWRSGTFEAKNIFRKEERDWKMVYLARQENVTNGHASISWRFRVTDTDLEIRSVKIFTSVAIFHPSASILITLTDEKGTVHKLLDDSQTNGLFTWKSSDSFQSCNSFILTCKLQGGEGSNAWQHAQLFRKSVGPNSSGIEDCLGLRVELDCSPKNVFSGLMA